MTDVTPDDPAAEQTATETTATEDQRVPLDRFKTVTSENKELRAQLDELGRWKEEQEAKQLSDLEREQQAREKAEGQATAALAQVQSLERGAWIRSAAGLAGFADADDAVALIGTADVEDADTAAKLVAALADKKPHLLKAAATGPAAIGSPLAAATGPVPLDAAGNPDPKAGLGADLLKYVRGGR